MRLIAVAVRNRWQIPDEMREKAPKIAADIATKGATEREKLRAMEVLAAMDRDNISALEKLDKLERLDAGESTENVTLTLLPPRLARHASHDPGPK